MEGIKIKKMEITNIADFFNAHPEAINLAINAWFKDRTEKYFNNLKQQKYETIENKTFYNYQSGPRFSSKKQDDDKYNFMQTIWLAIGHVNTIQDQNNYAAQFLLYCELNRMHHNPKKIFDITKGKPATILFSSSFYKTDGEKQQLYNNLNITFQQQPFTFCHWHRLTEEGHIYHRDSEYIFIKPVNGYIAEITPKLATQNDNGSIDINPVYNHTDEQKERVTEVFINNQSYKLWMQNLKERVGHYNYSHNEVTLVAQHNDTHHDNCSCKKQLIFPLISPKGASLQEQLFLTGLLSFTRSENNVDSIHFSQLPWIATQTKFKSALAYLTIPQEKKALYLNLVNGNIVYQTKITDLGQDLILLLRNTIRFRLILYGGLMTFAMTNYLLIPLPISFFLSMILSFLSIGLEIFFLHPSGIRDGRVGNVSKLKTILPADITLTKK